jgi:hypothetical protein
MRVIESFFGGLHVGCFELFGTEQIRTGAASTYKGLNWWRQGGDTQPYQKTALRLRSDKVIIF